MEGLKKLAEKYKWLCILTGGIGFFLSPFLWPFFLMIIFQSLSLAVPIIAAALIIKMVRKENVDEQKSNHGSKQTESTDFDTSDDVSGGSDSAHQKDEATDHLPKGCKKERTRSLKQPSMQHEESESECRTVVWYQLEGRERIQNLKVKLEKTGIRQFSISPEGVCCVPEGKYFRRVGMLRAFPAHETKILIQYLHKDHIHAVKKGKYLWLSWGKERK